jgi:hypothetical protein
MRENTVPKTQHLEPYHWKAGGPSPNPGGRPKGLAAYIRENSLDGRELADFLLEVVRGSKQGFKGGDRIKACEMLLNRGFGAQPVIDGEASLKPILDTSKLTQEELDFIENVRLGFNALVERVKGREAQA